MAKPKPARSETVETLIFLVKLIVIVAIFRSFVLSAFSIPSESMLPRLYVGDYLFVSKWNYGYSRWSLPWGAPLIPGRILPHTPARGDVVVFEGPKGDEVAVIKRVIGLPGDTVQMKHGVLWLDGKAVSKVRLPDFTIPITPNYTCDAQFRDNAGGVPICRYQRFRETLPDGKSYDVLDRGYYADRDDTGVYTVAPDTVFLMGDNRDDSADSRFAPPMGMGLIPMDRLEGRAVVSFFSTDGTAWWIKPWTWFTAARWRRIGEGF
ncbi:signal peptidase I [uncultured Sphingomonas sp.]|uniref:signal peptidase I n=1 Tax=uncultured Sphingomonas sp. TaxID=158754 RepID=UPI0035CAE6D1